MAEVNNALNSTVTAGGVPVNPKGVLGKDDFLTLLLVQLQQQDPTEPTDTQTILTQTSQLATLEASSNTNKALEELSVTLNNSLTNSNQYATVSSIGKIADLGGNSIILDQKAVQEDGDIEFEVYFHNDIKTGTLAISDSDENIVHKINLEEGKKGVYSFKWDGTSDNGNALTDGEYSITATYVDSNGDPYGTRMGYYPVESVKFDKTDTFMKLGSSYIPLSGISEIYANVKELEEPIELKDLILGNK